jgi:hypothetical protein
LVVLMNRYDAKALLDELARLDRRAKTGFAATCAQRLLPFYDRYLAAAGLKKDSTLDLVLDRVWAAVMGAPLDLGADRKAAESCVPDEDDEGWIRESGYAQNSAACVAYAVRTWSSDDAQEAVNAAWQIFELVDYLGQFDVPVAREDSDGGEMLKTLTEVSRVIAEDLAAARSSGTDWERIRQRALEFGSAWATSIL